jgi:hypothetical protein
MDTMQTPIVNELSRLSAHPDADLPSAALGGPKPGDRCAHRAEGEPIASWLAPPAPGS